MSDCIFCKIIKGDIPCNKVGENETLFAFRDINPQAPTHILIIPKQHIPKVSDLDKTQAELVGEMILFANELAEKEGLMDNGYRLIFNCGEEAGQAVFHIHLHLLGGRRFAWPPG